LLFIIRLDDQLAIRCRPRHSKSPAIDRVAEESQGTKDLLARWGSEPGLISAVSVEFWG